MVNVFEARFEQIAQSATEDRFSVPQGVIDLLGITADHDLIVEVASHKGTKIVLTKIKSGAEIYGCFPGHFSPGEVITVRITKIG